MITKEEWSNMKSKLGVFFLWFFAVTCISAVFVYGVGVGTILLLLIGIAALPMSFVRKLWEKIVERGKWIKPTVLGVSFVAAVMMLPGVSVNSDNVEKESKTIVATENTTGGNAKQDETTLVVNDTSTEDLVTEDETIEDITTTDQMTTDQITTNQATTEQVTTEETTEQETTTEQVTTTQQQTTVVETTTINSVYPVIGNKNSKAYHRTSCNRLPKEKNRVYFESEEEANEAGYDNPCDYCNP